MVSSVDLLSAIKEITNTKQLDRTELHLLLQDGILAALAKRYGPTVQAEVEIDEGRGGIKITRLRSVVAEVTDPSREISVEDAQIYDEGFEVGDMLEEPVDFTEFGRTAAMAAKQRIIQRVRERER
ncbi:MAG TPA: NusA N-terminal domain-containing protein, partial [Gemmatimonadaceae bacterium]|nr:NusA N-terminal domain-containing protein [Gemmatimonadaceae bacterium]